MNELNELKKKTTKLLNKIEKAGYELNSIDIGAISSIARAENEDDLNFLAVQHFERLYGRIFKK